MYFIQILYKTVNRQNVIEEQSDCILFTTYLIFKVIGL